MVSAVTPDPVTLSPGDRKLLRFMADSERLGSVRVVRGPTKVAWDAGYFADAPKLLGCRPLTELAAEGWLRMDASGRYVALTAAGRETAERD